MRRLRLFWALGTVAGQLLAGSLVVGEAPGQVRFVEVAAGWGIDFQHRHGGRGDFYMTETMGSGVLITDYDGDGDPDLLLIDSGDPDIYPDGVAAQPRLYRNDGNSGNDGSRFVDRTAAAGIVGHGYGMGGTAGDVDGDGDPDLYLTSFGPNLLLLNRGDGSFDKAEATGGAGDDRWSTSAAFADADSDGDLDLYVTSYVDFAYDRNPICGLEERQLRSYCHPQVYSGLPDRYFRNLGDGRFEEATEEAGVAVGGGNGLGVVWSDLDADGRIDLYVANDMTPNFHFRNLGGGRFEEVGLLVGTALSDRGEAEAGMGVDTGDLDGDGLLEVISTHLDNQTNALYSATAAGVFVDRRFTARLAEPSLSRVGFGVVFADFDLDGHLDIAVANGHIIHNIEEWSRGGAYRQRNQLFRNLGDGRFVEVEASGLDVIESSRGMAAGDLDADGDVDLVVSNSNARAELYENVSAGVGGFLAVDLRGSTANTAAVGAGVELQAGGRRQRREVRTASSYLSQSATTITFGLGESPRVDELRVDWPAGGGRRILGLAANRRLRVVQ